MHIYELRCPAQSDGEQIALEFRAEDPCEALLIAQKHPRDSRMELWEDGEKVCELTRTEVGGGDIWIVGPAD